VGGIAKACGPCIGKINSGNDYSAKIVNFSNSGSDTNYFVPGKVKFTIRYIVRVGASYSLWGIGVNTFFYTFEKKDKVRFPGSRG
jgi:hypothetical protein